MKKFAGFFLFVTTLLSFSALALAEVISTGSEDTDTVLQWLTSIIAIASMVANITPSPVDNKGVKIFSLLVNIAAINWKQLRDAWKSANVWAISVLGCAAFLAAAPSAQAATAVQLTCTAPQFRADGTPLTTAEIAGYTFYQGGAALNATLKPTCAMTITLAAGQCIGTAANFSVTATDTDDQESVQSNIANLTSEACALPEKPLAPTGLTVSPQ